MSALEERRQRAREAFYDTYADGSYVEVRGVEESIEAATRVHVDDTIVQASRPGFRMVPGSVVWTRTRAKLVRAFEAAGFEVTT